MVHPNLPSRTPQPMPEASVYSPRAIINLDLVQPQGGSRHKLGLRGVTPAACQSTHVNESTDW